MKRSFLLVLSVTALLSGCATLQGFARKPGRVSKTSDGWVLQGMRVPTGSHVVTVDVFQPKGKPRRARFAIGAYEPDAALACETLRFRHGGKETALENVNRMPHPNGESVQGDIDVATLGTITQSNDAKLTWCSMEIPFDAESIAQLREYAEMAGGT
jgi:hypothetical protein